MKPSEVLFPPAESVDGPSEHTVVRPAQPYWNPYVAGVGLGLVLLAAFVVMGRGLGASGAVASTITAGLDAIAPSHVANNPAFAEFLKEGTSPLMDWLVFEVLGVFVGGFLSG